MLQKTVMSLDRSSVPSLSRCVHTLDQVELDSNTSYISTELTGMTQSSLRPPSTTLSISPRLSSNETTSMALQVPSSWPKAPPAFKRTSAHFFSRPLMPVMVQPPLSENQNFLPIVQVCRVCFCHPDYNGPTP